MKRKICAMKLARFAILATCCLAIGITDEAHARKHKSDKHADSYSQTSMEIFPIKRGYDGAQFVVTKEGYLVSLPGLGVAPDATQVAAYKDAQNNIWYIDKNGLPIKLTAQEVEWTRAQINQQAQSRAAQYGQQSVQTQPSTTVAQQPVSTVIVQQQQPSYQPSSGAAGALTTGLAAAGGAMAGAALGNSMYHNSYGGIPYGQPVYRNNGHCYYNGSNGNKVYVNNSNNKYISQFNKQTNWQNSSRGNVQHAQMGNVHAVRGPSGNFAAARVPHGRGGRRR